MIQPTRDVRKTDPPRFTVDTHLFRELGILLVGRDSTALVELVKNAYDADATRVVLHGEHLSEAESGVIQVVDDGNGMTPIEFRNGFLRIASRLKDDGNARYSRGFRRRYTGAKGIGRLAAHKLAKFMEIRSTTWNGKTKMSTTITATIDWDGIEKQQTLDEIGDSVTLRTTSRAGRINTGTTITLSRLRERWTSARLKRFRREVLSFQPAPIMYEGLPKDVLATPALMRRN